MTKEQIDIINEAYLRANSIDAVSGLAYRNGHIREFEELDRARMTIFKLIILIKSIMSKILVILVDMKKGAYTVKNIVHMKQR